MAPSGRVKIQMLIDWDLYPLLAARLTREPNHYKRAAIFRDLAETQLRFLATAGNGNIVMNQGTTATDHIYTDTACNEQNDSQKKMLITRDPAVTSIYPDKTTKIKMLITRDPDVTSIYPAKTPQTEMLVTRDPAVTSISVEKTQGGEGSRALASKISDKLLGMN